MGIHISEGTPLAPGCCAVCNNSPLPGVRCIDTSAQIYGPLNQRLYLCEDCVLEANAILENKSPTEVREAFATVEEQAQEIKRLEKEVEKLNTKTDLLKKNAIEDLISVFQDEKESTKTKTKAKATPAPQKTSTSALEVV